MVQSIVRERCLRCQGSLRKRIRHRSKQCGENEWELSPDRSPHWAWRRAPRGGQNDRAITTLERAVREAPKDSVAIIELAKSQAAAGQTTLAEQTLTAAQGEEQKDNRLSIALAEFYLANKQRDAGIAIYEDLIGTKQASVSAYVSLAILVCRCCIFRVGEAMTLSS
jgi:predicted Zn-dependent protease